MTLQKPSRGPSQVAIRNRIDELAQLRIPRGSRRHAELERGDCVVFSRIDEDLHLLSTYDPWRRRIGELGWSEAIDIVEEIWSG